VVGRGHGAHTGLLQHHPAPQRRGSPPAAGLAGQGHRVASPHVALHALPALAAGLAQHRRAAAAARPERRAHQHPRQPAPLLALPHAPHHRAAHAGRRPERRHPGTDREQRAEITEIKVSIIGAATPLFHGRREWLRRFFLDRQLMSTIHFFTASYNAFSNSFLVHGLRRIQYVLVFDEPVPLIEEPFDVAPLRYISHP